MTSERDVVALVAHELKHPLAAIEVALPLMADAPTLESRQRARRVIERQLGYLRRLINDLQDAERARRGDLRLEKTRVDLRSMITEAIATFNRVRKNAA